MLPRHNTTSVVAPDAAVEGSRSGRDTNCDPAHSGIRSRQRIGAASNDLGFTRTPDGYVPIVSDYDQRALLAGQFLPRLRTAYSEAVVEEVRRRVRGAAQRTVESGVVKIRVRY